MAVCAIGPWPGGKRGPRLSFPSWWVVVGVGVVGVDMGGDLVEDGQAIRQARAD
jgi:hypothetical protein